ncbi:nitrogenase (plasmid) [Phormidium sp. CLA17]|uniref:Mo-dependent nitrogenase C-terminal domain-containing protein n=1 Tax=Leptolyngbya sp. Cla-17 TaxID=2803751 RepID=UPI00149175AF|nr:Mo-dependent nitrogenase C-terminal domain-containing protein [Leptolyngbya sp. Cla-17]MBM0744927.1 nitrogenase [Leptolyngbya sp. Cla-17]
MLKPLQNWLDRWKIQDRLTATLICWLIPAICPFAREIKLFGRTIASIPPLCKLNPLYDQLMGLRFRASTFLES